jgi:hypothetical protein
MTPNPNLQSSNSQSDGAQVLKAIRQRLFWSGGIALVVLIVCLFLFYLLTPELPDGPDNVDWSLLEGFMSLVSVALILGGSVFALREYISSEIQQRREELDREEEAKKVAFSVYKEIFDRLMRSEDVEARRWIINNVPERKDGEDEQKWVAQVKVIIHQRPQSWEGVPPGQEYLKQVLNTFDFVGFAALHYWPINEELLAWMSAPIAKVWERIGGYVENEAQKRREPDYYRAARDLGQRCVVWWHEHYPDATIIDDAT